jgi:hypothetical protein
MFFRYWISSAWWAHGGNESPQLPHWQCERQGCTNTSDGPLDLFCHPTDTANGATAHLLVLSGNPRVQTGLLYALRALLGGLALIASASASSVPLDVGAILIGLLFLVLPLRGFPRARVVAPILWLCATTCAVAAQARAPDSTTIELTVLAVGAMAALALVVALWVLGEDRNLGTRAVSLALVIALTSGLFCLALAFGLGQFDPAVTTIALLLCLAMLGGALASAVLAGLAHGVLVVKHHRQFHEPRRLTAPELHRPAAPRRPAATGFATQTVYAFSRSATRVATAVANTLNLALRLSYRAAEKLLHALALCSHHARRMTVWFSKLLATASADAVKTLQASAAIVLRVGRDWLQTTVLALGATATAAQSAIWACSLFASYLAGASVLDALAAILLTLASIAACVLVWWSLSRWPARQVAASALRSIEAISPTVFLTLVALGWIDGLIGLLGYGPMTPGYLTFAGTAVLVGTLVVAYRNKEAGEPSPEPSDAG